jgi:hypothetical protein
MMLIAGCASKRSAPMQVPAARVSTTHYVGSAISGPLTTVDVPDASAGATAFSVSLIALEQPPSVAMESLDPIGVDARLIVATREHQPVLPTNRLTAGARWGRGEAAEGFLADLRAGRFGQHVAMSAPSIAVVAGATASVAAGESSSDLSSATGEGRRIVFFVSQPTTAPAGDREGDAIELAIAVSDRTTAADGAPSGVEQSATPTSELVVLRVVKASELNPAVIVAPFPFADAGSASVVAEIRALESGDAASRTAAAARGRQEMLHEAQREASRAGNAAAPSAERAAILVAVEAADDPSSRRRALVFLANQTGARACEDACLVADDEVLAQLASELKAKLSPEHPFNGESMAASPPATAPASPPESATVGWILERLCFEQLSRMASDQKLPAELSAVLAAHAGEAGRHPSSMEQVLRGPSNRAELEARLIAENIIYLEDSSPAARVRAFDWLAGRGRAPAGYDPLAAAPQRRQALDKALAESAAAPSVPTPSPASR